MKALISPHENNRVCEVAAQEFPVAPPLHWVDCPEECTPLWNYVAGEFTPPVPPYMELTYEEKLAIIRLERDSRLQATDYTQLEDVKAMNGPELTALWAQYRQELRDMITPDIDVDNPQYPIPPV